MSGSVYTPHQTEFALPPPNVDGLIREKLARLVAEYAGELLDLKHEIDRLDAGRTWQRGRCHGPRCDRPVNANPKAVRRG